MLHQITLTLESVAAELISTPGHWGIFIAMAIGICVSSAKRSHYAIRRIFGCSKNFTFLVNHTSRGFRKCGGIDINAYWLGKYGGRQFFIKYGKYFLFQSNYLEQADFGFQKYGSWATFFARMMLFIRTFITLPDDITKMNIKKFIIFTLLGCIPWNLASTLIGFKLGNPGNVHKPLFGL